MRISIESVQLISNLWEFNQNKIVKGNYLYGICHDTDERIYLAARDDNIIKLDCLNGELLQHLLKNVSYRYDVCWTNSPAQITVLHQVGQKISTFNVSET